MSEALVLAPGRWEIGSGSSKGGKKATPTETVFWKELLFFFLCFRFCNSVFTWAPLTIIKGSKEACCNNSQDNKMQTSERKIQDRDQEI